MKTTTIEARKIAGKFMLNTVLAVTAAVVLPQIFHALGVMLGVGPMLGQMFMPMYIPVLIVGFFAGSWVGLTAGVLSVAVSFLLTGMPALAMLPYMVLELACLGFFAGTFAKTKWNSVIKVLAAQFCARAVRLVAVTLISMVFANFAGITATLDSYLVGLPGIALQLILVPVISKLVKRNA